MRFIHVVGHLVKGICASFINLFGENLSPIQEYINPKLSQLHQFTKTDRLKKTGDMKSKYKL